VTIHARISDSLGGFTDYTFTITVNDVTPTASMTLPPSLVHGSSGTFTASATEPSQGDMALGYTYLWNFGDGSTGTGASTTHTYATAGTYTVTITVTNAEGEVGTLTQFLSVS
jgi:PKD repeat protein